MMTIAQRAAGLWSEHAVRDEEEEVLFEGQESGSSVVRGRTRC